MKLATSSLWLHVQFHREPSEPYEEHTWGSGFEPPNLMLFSDTTRAFAVIQQMTGHIGTAIISDEPRPMMKKRSSDSVCCISHVLGISYSHHFIPRAALFVHQVPFSLH